MTYYDKYQKFRTNRIKYWQPKVQKAMQGIADSILKQPTMEAAIQAAHGLPPMQDLANVIKNIYADAGRIMGAYAYQDVMKQAKAKRTQKALMPIGYNEQLVNDIIAYYQTNLLNEAVIPISQNLRDYILAKLIEAQQTGNSITTVVDAIEAMGLVRKRAFLVARTETIKAANYGAKKGAQMTGHPMNKVWVSAQQNRTRRIPRDAADHLHMNGREAAMDELFSVPDKNGAVMMDRPGDSGAPAEQVCNCRCVLAFRVL
jgi:hypothetical protein